MTLTEFLNQPGNSAAALGRRLDVAHTTVLRWAEGKVPLARLHDVARATGIPPTELRPDLVKLLSEGVS